MTVSVSISDIPWTEVLDVAVDLLTREDVEGWLREHLATGETFAHVVTLNPEYVMTARRDPAFATALRDAELVTIDGAGLSLAVRLQRLPYQADRVTGVELTWMLAGISADTGARVFLLGAGPGIADRAAGAIHERFPDAVIAGTWAEGSPRPEDDAEAIRRIADSGATILLVAYGAPAQVHWIARNGQALAVAGVRIGIGIGGALDYISGNTPWAPAPVRRLGLEWAYRLGREPWRWRRQLVLPLFVALVVRETARQWLASLRGQERPRVE